LAFICFLTKIRHILKTGAVQLASGIPYKTTDPATMTFLNRMGKAFLQPRGDLLIFTVGMNTPWQSVPLSPDIQGMSIGLLLVSIIFFVVVVAVVIV
jgi:hypothetical protein